MVVGYWRWDVTYRCLTRTAQRNLAPSVAVDVVMSRGKRGGRNGEERLIEGGRGRRWHVKGVVDLSLERLEDIEDGTNEIGLNCDRMRALACMPCVHMPCERLWGQPTRM